MNILVNEHSSLVIPTQDEVIRALGIVGIVNLPAGKFLIVITKSKRVGNILENTIWKIEETRMIQITSVPLNQNQSQDHVTFKGMIESVLATPAFYYCYSFDITHTQQRLAHTISSFKNQPLIDRADSRFIWNSHLLKPFTANNAFRIGFRPYLISPNQGSLGRPKITRPVLRTPDPNLE